LFPGEQLVEGGSSLVPSGKLTVCYGKSPFLLGKLTISMAMFDSKLLNYQRVTIFLTICSGFLQRTPLHLHQSNENQKTWGDNTQISLPNKAHMSETNDTDVIQHGNSIEHPLVDEVSELNLFRGRFTRPCLDRPVSLGFFVFFLKSWGIPMAFDFS
jgi:hypothetical protein